MKKNEDIIFEETEDGGAIIGWLSESPSGYPRPEVWRYTKEQYEEYKQRRKQEQP